MGRFWPASLLFLTVCLTAVAAQVGPQLGGWSGVDRTPSDTLPRRLPPHVTLPMSPTLRSLQATALHHRSAYTWRQYADTAERAGFHAEAGVAYRRESDIYRTQGDPQAAEVETFKADANTARVGVYFARPADKADEAALYTGARLEPRLGCYLGAFIDRDDQIPSHVEDNQTHGDVETFTRLVGRRHASYFTYLSYGQPFPTAWVQHLQELGTIPQLAWEPHSLQQVQDDEYLRTFVQEAADSQAPIFLRFASEMNGEWTPYHDDPEAYKRMYRMVYQAFRRAPNVALIWCPNAVPQAKIDAYYPGDAYTDWVGVNFYNVPYLDNLRYRPGDRVHPTDLLDYVYHRYGPRKPIAIGEYAASHHSDLDAQARPEFAADRIAELYQSLATEYPRVKLINWYDCNNLVHAPTGRQLNNFLLTDDPQVLETYRQAIAPAWFLDATSWAAPVRFPPLVSDTQVTTPVILRATIHCWTTRPQVYFIWDGQVVHATSNPSAWSLRLDHVTPGAHQFRLVVYDDDFHQVADRSYRLNVQGP